MSGVDPVTQHLRMRTAAGNFKYHLANLALKANAGGKLHNTAMDIATSDREPPPPEVIESVIAMEDLLSSATAKPKTHMVASAVDTKPHVNGKNGSHMREPASSEPAPGRGSGGTKGKGSRKGKWSEGEARIVASFFANKLRAMGIGHIPEDPSFSFLRTISPEFKACVRANLPKERWNKTPLGIRLRSEHDHFSRILREYLKNPPKPAEAAPAPTPVIEQPKAAAPIPEEPQAAPVIELPKVESSEQSVPMLLARLAQAWTEMEKHQRESAEYHNLLMEEVDGLRKRVESMQARLDKSEKVERQEIAQEKAKLPAVAIVGCRKDEYDFIVEKVEKKGLKLDLRHYEQNTRVRHINAEWAVTMKFCGHEWTEKVRECIPNGQFTFVRGGIDQVVTQLEVWFAAA